MRNLFSHRQVESLHWVGRREEEERGREGEREGRRERRDRERS